MARVYEDTYEALINMQEGESIRVKNEKGEVIIVTKENGEFIGRNESGQITNQSPAAMTMAAGLQLAPEEDHADVPTPSPTPDKSAIKIRSVNPPILFSPSKIECPLFKVSVLPDSFWW